MSDEQKQRAEGRLDERVGAKSPDWVSPLDKTALDIPDFLHDRKPRLTVFQQKLLGHIRTGRNRHRTISELALVAKSNRLAVYSAMRSLEKKGIAGHSRTRKDEWGVIYYFETSPNTELTARAISTSPVE